MRLKKVSALVAVACLAVAGLSACGSDNGTGGGGAAANGPVTVEFWHSMTGSANGPELDKIIADFNALPENQGKIVVKGVFQGNYDELIAKYKAAAQTGATPTMAQVYDIGTQFMIDSGTVTPMQNFIDAEKYDTSDLQPPIAGYYTVNNKLESMPFNTSTPVLYYNKDVFKKAGLDPDKPPATLDEIRRDAEAIKKANAAKYPFGAAIYGWFIEEEMAVNGDLYCSPDNGRGSDRATQMSFDNPNTVKFLDWWDQMIKDGLSTNIGRDTTQAQSTFSSGASAITLESTGALGGFIKNASFEVGVGNYPKMDATDSGPIIGGASVWIMGNGHSDAEQQAAWSFVKYLSSPAVQAQWHIATGYFPTSQKALTDPDDVAFVKKSPQFNVAVKQMQNTPVTPATQGCAAGIMPQSRKATEDALEKVLTTDADTQQTLTAAVADITKQLADYNSSVSQ